MKMTKKGFTLIELMIVVAIIGILAAIAIPKFADLIAKSKDGATKGALSSVRGAIQIYYGDNEGWFPAGLTANNPLSVLTNNSKYINEMPLAKLAGTGLADSRTVKYHGVTGAAAADNPDWTGGWFYWSLSTEANTWGNFMVNCSQEDTKNDTIADTEAGQPIPWSTF
jgi:prepilin-type N-terminal cleavage/methylation domain-containing protein